MSRESSYLDNAVNVLQSLLSPDALGNSGVLRFKSVQNHPVIKRIKEVGFSAFPPPPASPSVNRDVIGDIANVICPHLTGSDLAISEVSNHSYSSIPNAQTIRAIAIHLFHQPHESDFLSFKPNYVHYKDLALLSEIVEADRLLVLKAALLSIHEMITMREEDNKARWKVEKPSMKKRANMLAKRADALRKELDSLETLGDCWTCQKALDAAEAEYDSARLQTIPPECSIKLVGAGFKVGVEAIWLENLMAPFQMSVRRMEKEIVHDIQPPLTNTTLSRFTLQTVNAPSVGIQMNIGGDTREQAGMGFVSFRADNLYLRSDNFPKSIKLDSFSARCEFVSNVPMTFKAKRRAWKVGSGLRISLKKIEVRRKFGRSTSESLAPLINTVKSSPSLRAASDDDDKWEFCQAATDSDPLHRRASLKAPNCLQPKEVLAARAREIP
jgi:hypothetical protein